MNITVKLIGPLVNKLGFSEKEMSIPEGTDLNGLTADMGFDSSWTVIAVRNGLAIAGEDEILPGDRIAFSPVYSGG